MNRPRLLLAALAATLLAAVTAAPAGAATQSFAGVLEDGRLVRFTSQAPAALTPPVRPRGLESGEQLVALATQGGRVYGLGSAARLYTVDPQSGQATALIGGRTLSQGLRGRRLSLAVTPDGARARILSEVGQDLFVDLRTGAETPGPGLRDENGAPLRPAVAMGPDGRLIGMDIPGVLLARETAPDSGVLVTSPLQRLPRQDPFRIAEPSAFTVGDDGRGFLLGQLDDSGRVRQSRLVTVETAQGTARAASTYLQRRLITFAALGSVPEDRTAPRAQVTVPRRISVSRLVRSGLLPVAVRLPEAGQVLTSLRIGRRHTGFSLASSDLPTRFAVQRLQLNVDDRRALRRAVGRRIRVVITTNDFAGNGRSFVRESRLVR